MSRVRASEYEDSEIPLLSGLDNPSAYQDWTASSALPQLLADQYSGEQSLVPLANTLTNQWLEGQLHPPQQLVQESSSPETRIPVHPSSASDNFLYMPLLPPDPASLASSHLSNSVTLRYPTHEPSLSFSSSVLPESLVMAGRNLSLARPIFQRRPVSYSRHSYRNKT